MPPYSRERVPIMRWAGTFPYFHLWVNGRPPVQHRLMRSLYKVSLRSHSSLLGLLHEVAFSLWWILRHLSFGSLFFALEYLFLCCVVKNFMQHAHSIFLFIRGSLLIYIYVMTIFVPLSYF